MKREMVVALAGLAYLFGGRGTAAEPPAATTVPAPAEVPAVSAGDGGEGGWFSNPETADGPRERVWGEAEYLIWWMKGASLPPLVTASPPGTPQVQAGVLGAPGTAVLFGGSSVNDGARSGGRFRLGAWLDDCQTFGVEGGYFFLEGKATGFSATSTGDPILARPFVDAASGQPISELIAFPGLLAGSVSVSESSTGLVGADALLRANLCRGCDYRLDVLGGYRFLRLADHLGVTENLVSTNPNNPNFVPLGTTLALGDRFDTTNEFHGLDLGLRGEVRRGPWVLEGTARVAVGDTHSVVDINGSTTVSVPGFPPPVTNEGGLLALSSNIGHFSRDRVAVVPELDLRAGYQVTSGLRVFVGYTFLYWDRVARAGDQIDLTVNTNLLPPVVTPISGPLRPAPVFGTSNFWAQGIELGLELRF